MSIRLQEDILFAIRDKKINSTDKIRDAFGSRHGFIKAWNDLSRKGRVSTPKGYIADCAESCSVSITDSGCDLMDDAPARRRNEKITIVLILSSVAAAMFGGVQVGELVLRRFFGK